MSRFYPFFRKHVRKYFCRRSQHEIEHNGSLVEPDPITTVSSDPTTSPLDNPSKARSFHSDPSTSATINSSLNGQRIQFNEEATDDAVLSSSSDDPTLILHDPSTAETSFPLNRPATSSTESSLNRFSIRFFIRALLSSIFKKSPKAPDIRSTDETLVISDSKNHHVTSEKCTTEEILETEQNIPLNPSIETNSIQPSSQIHVTNPHKPKNVVGSQATQVAKSTAHSGTKDMVSGSEQATSPSKLTRLPRDSTALRHYLESTSTRRAASPDQENSNKHTDTERRSVSNTPRTPPRRTVTTERSTPAIKVPTPNATLQRPSTQKRNFEPAPNDVLEESEELTHKEVEENADADISLITLIEASESTKDVIGSALRKFGMKEMTTEGYWNVRWSDKGIPMETFQKLLKYQRINRFPGSGVLMTKNNLAKSASKMKQNFPEEYDFVPETWCLPGEIKRVAQYIKAHDDDCFIVKPNDGCSGKGIIITRNIPRLQTCDKMVCQVYIRRPFLIDGFKFDLRIYTLMTSCRPLRLFVYNEGLARFATEQYRQPNQQNESNRYMHLTNYAVNKRSPSYIVDETKGTLRRLSTINKWLVRHNVDSKKVWESMDEAIVKTIISFLPALRHYYRVSFPDQVESNSCFQIMGFDILFDENLKPYVLEVNDSPSFKADVPLDKEMTEALIHDTFNILHLDENSRNKVLMEERRLSRRRLMSSTAQNRKKLHKEKELSQRSLTQRRIEWENTHMGNFRKVYPNESKMKHYKRFITAAHEIFQNDPW